VLPWVLFFLVIAVVALSDGFRGSDSWMGFNAWIVFGVILSLVVDGFFLFPAQRQLLEQFRAVAAQRFATKGGG